MLGTKDAPVGAVAIVGAEGTEGREELRALLASERARRHMAEQRLADTVVSPSRPRHSQCAVPDASPSPAEGERRLLHYRPASVCNIEVHQQMCILGRLGGCSVDLFCNLLVA